MTIDKKYVNQFINVTSKAAIASSFLVGKKNGIRYLIGILKKQILNGFKMQN